ncbi:MAG: membrane protein insertion efficiency factor YidD [Spirochaetae bacterium HGW-Spirochaetae-8]|nr:MAG: membrane protein insertion efficiency factor YidD [Spirochaetae bacterium HGW-Spirochaetae-8]
MNRLFQVVRKVAREIFLLPTHIYRIAISPLFPPSCLYTPSCSAYMVQAVRLHGIFKGTFMGLARIARCQHWFFLGGQDPVPERFNWNEIKKGYTIFRKHRLHKHGTEPDPDGQETPFTPPDDCLD